jgi:hypothetical protein
MDEGKVVQDGEPHKILRSEEARLIGIGIPKATRLYQVLTKDGVDLGNQIPLSSEDMARLIREALRSQ